QIIERRWDIVAPARDWRGRLGELCGEQCLRRAAIEWRRTNEHFVADDAERVEIGAMIRVWIGGSLLGRHVHRRAERRADGGDRAAAPATTARRSSAKGHALARGRDGFGNAEVGYHRGAAGEENVVRFDVAMDNSATVRV